MSSDGWFDRGRHEPRDPPFWHGALDHEYDWGAALLRSLKWHGIHQQPQEGDHNVAAEYRKDARR